MVLFFPKISQKKSSYSSIKVILKLFRKFLFLILVVCPLDSRLSQVKLQYYSLQRLHKTDIFWIGVEQSNWFCLNTNGLEMKCHLLFIYNLTYLYNKIQGHFILSIKPKNVKFYVNIKCWISKCKFVSSLISCLHSVRPHK